MKKSIRISAVLLALLMIIGVFAGCKGKEGGKAKDPNEVVSGELGLVLPNYEIAEGTVVKILSHSATALVGDEDSKVRATLEAAYGVTAEVTQVGWDEVNTKFINSVLAEEAVKSAIADYYRRQGIDPEPYVGCTGDCEACHGHDHGHGNDEE